MRSNRRGPLPIRQNIYIQDQLFQDPTSGDYTVLKPDGSKQIFSSSGFLQTIQDAFGDETVYSYTSGQLTSVVTGSGTGAVGYFYSYTGSLITSVILRVGGVTSDFDVRQVVYTYNGSNLELAQLEQNVGSGWVAIKTIYLRYHHGTSLLWFAVEDDAYKQMQSVDLTWPQAATHTEIAGYADQEFHYDDQHRVTLSKTKGGKYSYSFSYSETGPGGAVNYWATKTTVTQPDESVRVYYYNDTGSLLLLKVADTSENVWYPVCQQFDVNSRLILSASSSAVASVDESTAGLFTLKTGSGLIRVFGYDSNGNQTSEGLQQGTASSVVTLSEMTYGTQTVAGVSIYPLASSVVYRDATDTSSSNPATTSYDYTWLTSGGSDTFQIETVTTTLPVISTSENGSGTSNASVETYDQYGFLTARTDEVGTVTSFEYDVTTGALTQKIEDSGSGGLNLTTTYENDAIGRRTQTLGPVHSISLAGTATSIQRAQWIQYLDAIDQVRTINGYVTVSTGAPTVINPVGISVSFAVDPDVTGGRMEEDISAIWTGSGVPDPGYNFSQADYVRWSTKHIDPQNELTCSRMYYLIPAGGLGAQGANYAQTGYGYDSAGRRIQVTSPMSTITIYTLNAMSWRTLTQVGTTLSNLVSTEILIYDGGAAGGDGDLTQRRILVDGTSGNDRVTNYVYDWRDRQIKTQASDDGVRTIVTLNTFNNRDNVIEVQEYLNSIAGANLINQATTSVDALSRSYQTQRFGVDISTGAVGPALTGNTYYDPVGRVVRDEPAGKVGFVATKYDAVGRSLAKYRAFGGTLDTSNPGSVSGATVIEQWEMSYDAASNLISSLNRQRFADATGTGSLENPSTDPTARVYFQANYPDALGRAIAVANYGTNGGSSWSRPSAIPSSSETILVTAFIFDNSGLLVQTTDAMGTATLTVFDQAARRTVLIENYQPGSGSAPSVNKTTEFTYNDDGNLLTLTALNATTGDQKSQWIYGVTIASGSTIESNGLLYQKIYPGGSGPSDLVTNSYNRQGQPIEMIDEAGTTHAYSYDYFGRPTNDAVTAFGTGVDTTVQSIARAYEARGMLQTVTSNGASAVFNQVEFAYNTFSQLAIDYQEHNGAVDTSTTLNVAYSYADGTANTVRPTATIYPDGTEIDIAYASTAADALSRPDGLQEDGMQICSYEFLGMKVFVNVTYDAASGLELTAVTGGTGDAGDQYTALDRFGRLVETLWQTDSVAQVHTKYGRNQFGGMVWRQDLTAAAASVNTEDNFYWYDGLYQVQEHQRGPFNGTSPNYTGIVGTPSQDENFGYDATGNWVSYSSVDPANSQTRTQNAANEITQISASVGNVDPTYDPVGNMTALPTAPGTSTGQYTLTWDAWNRLISVSSGETSIAQYAYDGLTRRLSKTNSDETRQYYYSKDWRVLEERVDGSDLTVDRQYTWGLRDRWDLCRRVRYRMIGDSIVGTPSFALRDDLDPVAIADASGDVEQRFAYDSFGGARILDVDYSPWEGPGYDWNFLFHCEFQDDETGLYNYGYRYYSPYLGRWLSRDPVQPSLASNLYDFVENRPSQLIDVFGLQSLDSPSSTLESAIARGAMEEVEELLEVASDELSGAEKAIGRAWLKRVAECKGIHDAYKLFGNCGGCKTCVILAQVKPIIACLTAVIALRTTYVLRKCDDILQGSISGVGGSAAAELGHLEEIAQMTKTLNDCFRKQVRLT